VAPSVRGPARKPTNLARHVLIPSGAQGLATARTCGRGRLPGADLRRLRRATGGLSLLRQVPCGAESATTG
jgi:hypothetical protein